MILSCIEISVRIEGIISLAPTLLRALLPPIPKFEWHLGLCTDERARNRIRCDAAINGCEASNCSLGSVKERLVSLPGTSILIYALWRYEYNHSQKVEIILCLILFLILPTTSDGELLRMISDIVKSGASLSLEMPLNGCKLGTVRA